MGAAMEQDDADLARATFGRVSVRIIPFLFVLYLFNQLDRTNVAIAALQMNRDLHFSAAAYGFGVGVFFISYALLEVPSNLILARVGARRWIARIMITWGLISAATLFVRTPGQFYAIRFLLGVAEAGFFPGVLYYLSEWFPAPQLGLAMAGFMIAIPLSSAIGGPFGGWLLGFDGHLGLRGWQWLYLVEGIPSTLLGLVVFLYLTDKPEEARWLSDEQRGWLVARLRRDHLERTAEPHLALLRVLLNPLLWLLSTACFIYLTTSYTLSFWAPIVIRDALHTKDATTGWVVGAIGALSACAGLLAAAHSDRRGERFLHAAAGVGLMGVGFIVAALFPTGWGSVTGLLFIGIGARIFQPPFWCIPTLMLGGTAAAAGLAFINSIGNIGGFVGPYAVGLAKDATGGTRGVFLVFGVLALGASGLLVALRRNKAFAPGGRQTDAYLPPDVAVGGQKA